VGGLRGGERAAATQHAGEGGSEGGGQLGPGRVTLILKCGATQHGAAQATATPLSMAPH
jgi:hypothetical protein